jgi:hypothetical protein
MNRVHLYVLAFSLIVIGMGLFLYKTFVLGFPLSPQKVSEIWNVEAHMSFIAQNRPAKVSLFIPRASRRFAIVNENFISQGFGITTATEGGNRQVEWSIRKAKGKQILYYRAEIRHTETKAPAVEAKPPEIEDPKFEGPYLAAAQSLVADIRYRSADADTFVKELLKRLTRFQPDDNIALLLGKQTSIANKVRLAVRILAQAGLPARSVHGIRLEDENNNAPLLHWMEIYDEKQWRAYDPITGEAGIPADYMPWWRGNHPLVQVKGGDRLQATLSVNIKQEEAVRAAIQSGKIKSPMLLDFSLFSLPVHAQAIYRVLLLVPLGAFLLVILRNVIGIKTFGTFMPVLIALAFRETMLVWGIILFTMVVGLGLTIRLYLEHLKLLVVPRLASVLTVVVLLMALLSVVTHKLGLERGLSVALFPMVIITMTIERMSIVWEERGASEALQQGLGSLVVAAIAYLIMSISPVEHIIFVFPELLLVLLAGTLLLGRYYGYRLLELLRFRALVKGNT